MERECCVVVLELERVLCTTREETPRERINMHRGDLVSQETPEGARRETEREAESNLRVSMRVKKEMRRAPQTEQRESPTEPIIREHSPASRYPEGVRRSVVRMQSWCQ